MRPPSLRNPYELAEAPELAVLAILQFAAEQVHFALLAVHTELCDGVRLDEVDHPTPSLVAADALVDLLTALADSIERYRQLAQSPAPQHHPAPDIDF